MSNTARLIAIAMKRDESPSSFPGQILHQCSVRLIKISLHVHMTVFSPSTETKCYIVWINLGGTTIDSKEPLRLENCRIMEVLRVVIKKPSPIHFSSSIIVDKNALYHRFGIIMAPFGMKYSPYVPSSEATCGIPRAVRIRIGGAI